MSAWKTMVVVGKINLPTLLLARYYLCRFRFSCLFPSPTLHWITFCLDDKVIFVFFSCYLFSHFQDTFRGRVCECPFVNGVQFEGDGYSSCKGEIWSQLVYLISSLPIGVMNSCCLCCLVCLINCHICATWLFGSWLVTSDCVCVVAAAKNF